MPPILQSGMSAGLTNRLLSSSSGRGAEVTNRPLFNPVAFDRTRFEGDLPTGWDAELYRNGELIAFSRSDGSQRYVFDNVAAALRRQPLRNHRLWARKDSSEAGSNISMSDRNRFRPARPGTGPGVSQPGKDMLGDFVGRDDGGGLERRGVHVRRAGSAGKRPGRTWPRQADLGRLARCRCCSMATRK